MGFNLPAIEKEILAFWQKQKVFSKSLERASPHGDYVFYDGPPFATGLPHYGHIVASLIKDIVPRYFTMRGFRVERRWGWDCHGLPIENIVEQENGFKHKRDILDFGVDKFNDSCRSKVMKYRDDWRKTIDRLGRWADMDHDYKTMDTPFMESVWWAFKTLWDKGLIYEGFKSMHICPRCETTLSQSEVAEGYKTITDRSVIVKFKVQNSKFKVDGDVFLLAWTTTPWTLPGNMALAVGDDLDYVAVKIKVKSEKLKVNEGDIYVLAKGRVQDVMGGEYEVVHEFKGKELVGQSYEPVFDYYKGNTGKEWEKAWKVFAGDFVTTEDGTGIVHIAPAFGEDDMQLGKREGLPFAQHVGTDGRFVDAVKDFVGFDVKPKRNPRETDEKIVEFLKTKGLVFASELYEHTYPHCWRCETPLLNYAMSSLFVAVTKIKDQLLEQAKNITWMPEHIKEGRFGNWLEGAKDWAISRQRFWATAIPLWRCHNGKFKVHNSKFKKNSESETSDASQRGACGHTIVVGSIAELEQLSGTKVSDLHKDVVDKVTFACEMCGGTMQRIPDVIDCWFESGSMPYAQQHYPFENKEKFEHNFPAQFIAEGVDQTRAWFYYLHVLAVALFGKNAFQHVVVNGIVLAEDGRKMSKRLKNYPEPEKIFEQYGVDAMRYYLATSPVLRAEDLRFVEKGVDEVVKKYILTLLNVLQFYKTFAGERKENSDSGEKLHVLDQWILVILHGLTKQVTAAYESYDLNRAARPLLDFVNDLSTWYVRRSRDRFKSEDEIDKVNAVATLQYVLVEFSKLMAPVMPFLAEYIYKEAGGEKESVHLEEWPMPDGRLQITDDREILEKMGIIRKIVELALAKRAEAGIPVRQPLGKLKVISEKLQVEDEYIQLINDEVNVKHIEIENGIESDLSVQLDTELTPELKQEGIKRELVRHINALRKKIGLTIHDRIKLGISTEDEMIAQVVCNYSDNLMQDTLADSLIDGLADADHEAHITVGNVAIDVRIKLIKDAEHAQ